MILYRTTVPAIELRSGATLYVGSKVRDSAVVRFIPAQSHTTCVTISKGAYHQLLALGPLHLFAGLGRA